MSQPDLFDVYGEYPEAGPVPMVQALREFRKYVEGHHAHFQEEHARMKAGTSTTLTRAASSQAWAQGLKRVELQLFRSIMASEEIAQWASN